MKLAKDIRASVNFLNPRDRRLLGLATLIQMVISVLDLLGIVLLGIVGALAISFINARQAPDVVTRAVSAIGLHDISSGSAITVLAIAAAVLLLTKSVLSPLFLTRIFRFLGRREAMISARLAQGLLQQPLTFVQRRSSQKTASALIVGANATTFSVIGSTVIAASEITLLSLLAIVIFVVKPVVALGAVLFFAVIAVALQSILGQRNADFATQRRQADVASLVAIQEVLGAYREITVADRRSLYVDRLRALRTSAASAAAGTQAVAMMPKYISEVAMVVGSSVLAAILFTSEPTAVAAGTFVMFVAAATRAMPSLLRLQTAMLTIRAGGAGAAATFALAEDLRSASIDLPPDEAEHPAEPSSLEQQADFEPRIDLNHVTFGYAPGTPALHDISISVAGGQSVALVGRSGAGKSTLADLILGVLDPDSGAISVGGLPPGEAVTRWPGRIAYVPQDVMLSNDSLRANVALGIPKQSVEDDQVWEALRAAHLDDYVRAQPTGLDTVVGERGLRLSGGQRQRLGIARALFTKPRLLVLDEATSALDAETEQAITDMLDQMEQDVTTVIIAHRLSTVRHADLVVYLEEGRQVAIGTFDAVCAQVPALRRQAELMGLSP